MIKNDLDIKQTFDCDDFDKMLNDFIHRDLSIKSPNKQVGLKDYVVCSYKGKDYNIPKGDNKTIFFKGESCYCNGKNMMQQEHHNRIYVNPYVTDREITLTLFDIKENKKDEELGEYTVYLYKEGLSNPIDSDKNSPYYGDLRFCLNLPSDNLYFGKYFILIESLASQDNKTSFVEMGNCMCYPFSIMPEGNLNDSPDIRDLKIKAMERKSLSFTMNNLVLSFSTDVEFDSNRDLRFVCFNNNNYRICETTIDIENEQNKFVVELVPDYVWLPGDYVIYCEINGEPCCKISFVLGEKNCIKSDCEKLTGASVGYIQMKYLERSESNWQYLSRIHGTHRLREKILENYPNLLYNRERHEKKLKRLYANHNFIVIGHQEKPTDNVLSCFMRSIKDTGSFRLNDCSKLIENNNSQADFNSTMDDAFPLGCDETIGFYRLSSLFSGNGSCVVHRIMKYMQGKNTHAVVLYGRKSEVDKLMECYPELGKYFLDDNILELEELSVVETIYTIQDILKEQDLQLSEKALSKLSKCIIGGNGRLSLGDINDIRRFVVNNIVSHFRSRVLELGKNYDCDVECCDIDFKVLSAEFSSYEDSVKGLNKMIGLENLKKEIATLSGLMKFNVMRREMGLKTCDTMCHHMIFTGNPGTGKTTVAKTIGKIFHSLGLLSKGEVIVTERSRMVGRYIGETELNMRALLEEARGNVLFVDEAYSLCDTTEDRKDFGYHALESLLTVLSQKNPDMVVIFAGYEKEIERMLQANQGLKGRFPHHFHFEDYSAEELMKIACNLIKKEEYILDKAAESRLKETIEDSIFRKDKDFANARWIEQYILNGVIPAIADRLIRNKEELNRDNCCLITIEDIDIAYKKYRYNPIEEKLKEKINVTSLSTLPRVGFRIA